MPHPSHAVARTRRLVVCSVVAATVSAATACSSSRPGPAPLAPSFGSLTITITAPAAVTPTVTVSGTGGYSKTVSATTTLTGLAVGSYTVAAMPFTTSDQIVRALYTATVSESPVQVTSNMDASSRVSYVLSPGTGGLWVVNSAGKNLARYSAGQLAASTTAAPATTLAMADDPTYGAFDAAGRFYVVFSGTRLIQAYAAAALASSGAPTPDSTAPLNFSSGTVGAIAIDAAGALWVVRDSSLLKYPSSELASDDPGATVAIQSSLGSLSGAAGLAFDSAGDLWVGNSAGAVVEFRADQLTASGTPTPAVELTGLGAVASIAFDAVGNLWTPILADGVVNEYSASALKHSGGVTPVLHITGLHGPQGIAFDESGNLWIANTSSDELVEFNARQLVGGGATPTPNVTITLPANSAPQWIAFDPHPLALPLKP